ncbi:homeodomain-interacting protein kinase 3-like isoform X1 [Paralichthys olivaceus]|uniref:homeodomain-interacting protein kinase 3-like isoform X1 n=2 Tax=Paralichthys olivaceus TaxID=8255 RepID=UPI00375054FE
MAAMLPAQDNQLVPGSLLSSGSCSYQVQSFLGQGNFGKVVKCKRLEDDKTVAIKMIKLQCSSVKMINQEVATLKKLRSLDLDKQNIVQWYQFFTDREHICLEFEHLDKSLFDFMKERNCRHLLLKEIRPIVQQIAHALKHLKAVGIIHADLKLENIVLVDQLREPFRVKVIDFGLACDVSAAKLGSYIQTRPYRSPEIILGHPFTEAIDMWSLGQMAAEMYLGALLYPGLSEYEMIKFITETQGQLPDTMLNHGGKTARFYMKNNNSTTSVWKLKTPEQYHKETGRWPMENRCWKFTSLDNLLLIRPINTQNSADKVAETADVHMFVDMLKGMLQLDPKRRITPLQVLEHKFINMRHIASTAHQGNYFRCCFQMMDACKKKIQTSECRTALCRPLKQSWCKATNPVQQNPPSGAEGKKTDKPHHTDLHPCTTTQTGGTDESTKQKTDPNVVPPPKKMSPPGSNKRIQGNWENFRRRHESWHCRPHQLDQRTRPGDHHHTTGPSGSTQTEGQALSGLKRKGRDHADVRPSKKPADHHHHTTSPSGSTQTEGQALSGLKRKGRDHADVRPSKRPADHDHPTTSPSGSTQTEGQTLSELKHKERDHADVRPSKKPADHHHHTTSPSGSTQTEGQTLSELKHKERDHADVRPSKRPADHHHHTTSPSGSTQTESQTLSGLKRKGRDHADVRPSKRPADHDHPTTSPSGSTQTEGQSLSELKHKERDHADVRPSKRPADHHHHTTGPSGSTQTESSVRAKWMADLQRSCWGIPSQRP